MSSLDIQKRIAQAINTTKQLVPGYFERTLTSRQPGIESSCGSVFEHKVSEEDLIRAVWEPANLENVEEGCTAFTTKDLKGFLGVIDLNTLDLDTKVQLEDRKGTGNFQCLVKWVRGKYVDFTTIILGQEQGQEVVFTVHPGDPVSPSKIKADPDIPTEITVAEALRLGFTTAKII